MRRRDGLRPACGRGRALDFLPARPQGQPHATMEVEARTRVVQVQGRGNSFPKAAYRDRLLDALLGGAVLPPNASGVVSGYDLLSFGPLGPFTLGRLVESVEDLLPLAVDATHRHWGLRIDIGQDELGGGHLVAEVTLSPHEPTERLRDALTQLERVTGVFHDENVWVAAWCPYVWPEEGTDYYDELPTIRLSNERRFDPRKPRQLKEKLDETVDKLLRQADEYDAGVRARLAELDGGVVPPPVHRALEEAGWLLGR